MHHDAPIPASVHLVRRHASAALLLVGLAGLVAGEAPASPGSLPNGRSIDAEGRFICPAPAKGGEHLYLQGQAFWANVSAGRDLGAPLVIRKLSSWGWNARVHARQSESEREATHTKLLLNNVRIAGAAPDVGGAWTVIVDGAHTVRQDRSAAGRQLSMRLDWSRTLPVLCLSLIVENTGTQPLPCTVAKASGPAFTAWRPEEQAGVAWIADVLPLDTVIAPGASAAARCIIRPKAFTAAIDAEAIVADAAVRWQASERLRLVTPDPIIDAAHRFAVQRVIMAPMWVPGADRAAKPGVGGQLSLTTGSSYSPSSWANDSIESPGPLPAILGDAELRRAMIETCLRFLVETQRIQQEKKGGKPPRVIAKLSGPNLEGQVFHRGDAAMILHGLSLFLAADGERATIERLWPLVRLCVDDIAADTRPDGLYGSPADEGEGRWGTGPINNNLDQANRPPKNANASSNGLALSGLRTASRVAAAMGRADEAADLAGRADRLAAAIDNVLGGEVDGQQAYRYFPGGPDKVGGWALCFPAWGLSTRSAGIIALGKKHWSPREQALFHSGKMAFWRKVTPVYLAGLFRAGAADQGRDQWHDFASGIFGWGSAPYLYDDGILAIASAAVARTAPEGLFGLEFFGGHVEVSPALPSTWPKAELRGVVLGGIPHDLLVERVGAKLRVSATPTGGTTSSSEIEPGGHVRVVTPLR